MKKYIFLVLLIIISISSTTFFYVFFQEKIQLIDTKRREVCSTNKLKEYSNYNIYSYCLDDIFLLTNKAKYNITDYLNKHGFENILDLFEVYSIAYDGGSKIYKLSTPANAKEESVLIIDCNSKQFHNNNIYIIPEDNDIGIKICQQDSN